MQNFIKTIINAVQSWTKAEIKKNRTHWEDEVETNLISDTTLDFSSCDIVDWGQTKSGYLYEFIQVALNIGQKYDVVFDGETYSCIAFLDKKYGNIVIGNGAFVSDLNEENGLLFAIGNYEADEIEAYVIVNDQNSHTFSISTNQTVVHKLDSKYLDLPTNLATTDDVESAKQEAQEAMDVANEAQNTANNAQTTANKKMDKNNPVGTGSFSMNRKSGTTVGTNSVAIGYNTTASGNYSHAIGCDTIASGDYSHAEGRCTTASSIYSHAEGAGSEFHIYVTGVANSTTYVIDSTNNANVHIGCSIKYNNKVTYITQYNPETLTIKTRSTLSNTDLNNAKVYMYTNSSSSGGSHTEGSNTIAASSNQHVQGQNNIADNTNKYAHIVGNGTTTSARSNAHTLDWDGVGWFQGGLQVGGNAQDDGAKNVLLEGEAYDYFILNDANTGTPYKIQIIDGNLVSSVMTTETTTTDETESTT